MLKVRGLKYIFKLKIFIVSREQGTEGGSLGKVELSRDEERPQLERRDAVSFTILILWNASANLSVHNSRTIGCARADFKSCIYL